jgi:serine/threonine protein kinase/sugar lactone lactonase YvrE
MNDSLFMAELLEEIYQRVEAGESVDVRQYAEKYPQLSSQLEQLIPAMAVLGEFSQSAHGLHRVVHPTPSSHPTQLGDFRLVRQIGQGGMGVVFEAEQLSLSRRVALKVLPFASLWPKSVVERFHQEVRIAASLEHPSLLPIFGYGCENGVHFYSMKLVDGGSIADVILQRRSQNSTMHSGLQPISTRRESNEATPGQTVDLSTTRFENGEVGTSVVFASSYEGWAKLALSAAEALAYSHERGVIHRDIKPSNLLLDSQGKLFVADFGLARGETDINLTRTGELLGTPRYMSPEQAAGRQGAIDARTDIYALGATLYELITLQPVIRAVHRAEALRELQNLHVIPPRQHDAHIPQSLEQIVLKCLQPDPRDRYRSANDLADDLRRFLDGRAVVAGSPGWVRRASRYVHAHPRTALGVVAVLALCVLIPGIFWFADGGHPSLTSRGPPEESGLKDSTATGHPLTKNSSLESPDMLRSSLNKNQNTQDRSRAQRRLLVEALEDRKLLAVLAADGFESANFNGGSGWIGAGWQVAGDATVLSSNSPHAGLYQARLRASSGDLIRAVDVTGQTDLRLQFWSKVSSFESLDKAVVRVSSDGIVWNQVQQFGSAQSDNQYHFYDIPINNPSNTLYVGFSAGMSASNDQWYLDDIAVTGVPIGPPQISISDATASEGNSGMKFLDNFIPDQGLPQTFRGIVFGPDGNGDGTDDLYVVSSGTNEVLRFDALSGTLIDSFLKPSQSGVENPLDDPLDLTFGPDGHLYVTSRGTDANPDNNQVLRFDGHTGNFIDVFATGLQRAISLDFGDDGNLYVGNRETNAVQRFNRNGASLGNFIENAAGSEGKLRQVLFGADLTDDGKRDIYVVNNQTAEIYRYDAIDGSLIDTISLPSSYGNLTWLEVAGDGSIYASLRQETGKSVIHRLDGVNGESLDAFALGRDGWSMGIDGNEMLYVSGNGAGPLVDRIVPASMAVFTVNLSAPGEDPITVAYSTSNSSAIAGSDYVPTSGTLVFEPGVTSRTIIVPTIDDSELEGDETFYVNLTSAVGGEIVDEQGVGTIVDNEVPPQVSVSAVSESSIYGSVNGSYHATQAADGVVQTLTEERYSSNRRTRLEHRWRFDNVTSGDSVELLVVASQTNSNPVETFALSYSTDNANWTNLGNLGPSSYPLPNTLSGTVYIRVVDTDRSNNERTLDVLAVDQLLIRTTTAPANLSSPLAPPPSSFATTSSFDQLSTEERVSAKLVLDLKTSFRRARA